GVVERFEGGVHPHVDELQAVARRRRDAWLALQRLDLLRAQVLRDVGVALFQCELLVGRLRHVLDEDRGERWLRPPVVRIRLEKYLRILRPVVDDEGTAPRGMIEQITGTEGAAGIRGINLYREAHHQSSRGDE